MELIASRIILRRGLLEKNILLSFFKDLIPGSLSITSGIVCDAQGRSSRQLDFIIKDNRLLPSILMETDVSVVPVETVHLIAEIKTKLRTSDLAQVKESRKVFNQLQLARLPIPNQPPIKIPSVILAFDNEISRQTLEKWMLENGDVVSICIVDYFCLSKSKDGIECHEAGNGNPDNWETLAFSIQLFQWLQQSVSTNRGLPVWQAYLASIEQPQ